MSVGFHLTYSNAKGDIREWVVQAEGLEAAQAIAERELGSEFKLFSYRRVDPAEAETGPLAAGKAKQVRE